MSSARLRGRALFRHRLIALSVAACFTFSTTHSAANPTGGTVASGSASFAASGNTLTITNSANAIINWQSFSIGVNEITRFLQSSGSSAVLNRVLGANGVIPQSVIDGILSSNGRVFLLNSSGIAIGANARIDVAGFVASSLNLSDADFLAGRMRFTETPGAGKVSNAGLIDTTSAGPGGRVFLVGPDVQNSGVIRTPQGEIILAAGKSIELVSENSPFVTVNLTADSEQALNVGQLIADSGRIGMFGALVRQSGVAQANSAVVGANGEIRLVATNNVTLDAGSVTSASGGAQGGNVEVSAPVVVQAGDIRADGDAGGKIQIDATNFLQAGTLSASGSAGAGGTIGVNAPHVIQTAAAVMAADGAGGAGGSIAVDASGAPDGLLFSSARYSANGDKGGNIKLLGHDILLLGASADASGANGGGTILVGGDLHGANPAVANASTTGVNFSTTLKADATQNGDGGKIVVWSDSNTQFYGSASTRGGAQSGNGGSMEISGRDSLTMGGFADAGAPNGAAGSLLLDPKNIIIDSAGTGGLASFQLVDPHPGASERFGTQVVVLSNQNVVVTDPNDSFTAGGAGAVYLFSSSNGSLLSTLTGSTANDHVGSGTITTLPSGNFLVLSPSWNNGATATSAGAVTFASGTNGVSGPVSAGNSLVGSLTNDQVGSSVMQLFGNGNFVVQSPNWNNTAGAATFGNGTTGAGIIGAVSATNSLVGSTANDRVGSSVIPLSNGNYVVDSPNWSNGTATSAGAVTLGSGTTGIVGAVSVNNSLVGSTLNDGVGSFGIRETTSGNYVVISPHWSNDLGAVTFVNATTAPINVAGAVLATNSLVGSTSGDRVGIGSVTVLGNGNYLVSSPNWFNTQTAAANAGAVTLVNGTSGAILPTGALGAPVSLSNSLVGSTAGDQVGSQASFGFVTLLTNGNYVVRSPSWNISALATLAGAVTFGTPTALPTGAVSSANSLVGSSAGDQIGSGGVIPLSNGNYVVISPNWDRVGASPIQNVGAVTLVDGSSGNIAGTISPGGTVSITNSLVGSTLNDSVGSGGIALVGTSNYVVRSPFWTSTTNGAASAGAVTWVDGSNGNIAGTASPAGTVSATNSLVGSTANDSVGNFSVSSLSNGNYVVDTPTWNNNTGAITLLNGGNGNIVPTGTPGGAVSATNSLVGSTAGDQVGSGSIYTLIGNPNFVVNSPTWNNGAVTFAGAVTFVNGTNGLTGQVTSSNSLVGSTANDQVGSLGVIQLTNGNYVVRSPSWSNTGVAGAGAITFGSGTSGVSGPVSAINSLVGSNANDQVGGGFFLQLSNGNYLVGTTTWNNNTGAVTLVNGANGNIVGTTSPGGTVSAANSLVGSTTGDQVGSGFITPLSNGNYVVSSPNWNGGMGAVTFGSGTAGVTGPVSSSINSLVGSTPDNATAGTTGDHVGGSGLNGGIFQLGSNYLVSSPDWNNLATGGRQAGALTWVNSTSGNVFGQTSPGAVVSATNSLVGGTTNDRVGELFCDCSPQPIHILPSGNFVLVNGSWTNPATGAANAGAVTFGSASGIAGLVSSANSIIGAAANDQIGSGGIFPLTNGNFVVSSPNAANGALTGAGLVHVVTPGAAGPPATGQTFSANPSSDVTITPASITAITNTGTALVLQANNDVTLNPSSDIVATGPGSAALTLQAGRSVVLNSSISNGNGAVTIVANERTANGVIDANRDPGAASITMAPGTIIKSGTSDITLTLNDGAGLTNSTSGNIVLGSLVTSGNALVQNLGPTAGSGIVASDPAQLVTAGSAAFDVNGASGGGGIGTVAAPIRVRLTNLAARTQVGGAFFDSPLQGLTIGTAGALTGITASGAGNIQIAAAGPISIGQNVSSGSGAVTLTAGGTLTEAGGTISTVGALTTSSSGGTTLGAANTVTAFNATNAVSGNVVFANAQALTVTGVSETGGGNVTLTTSAGAMTLAGQVNASTGAVTLTSAGNINGGGPVAGASVLLSAPAGAIGSPTAGIEVVTPTLQASAANGITLDLNGLAPQPAVINLLQNSATGGIVLNAHGGATFTTLVSNPGGSVTINTFSPLDVNAGITAGNSIFLSTSGGTGATNDMSLNGPYTYNTSTGAFEVTIGLGGQLALLSGTPLILTAPLFPNPLNITRFTFIQEPTEVPQLDTNAVIQGTNQLILANNAPSADDLQKKNEENKKKKEAALCK